MSRAALVARRYEMSERLVSTGASLFVVGDSLGARLDSAVRDITRLEREYGDTTWEPLLAPAKGLRWRLIMRPQPISHNPRLVATCHEAREQVRRMRLFTGDDHARLLDGLDDCLASLAVTDPPNGEVLADSVSETGPAACFVVAGSGTAAAELQPWLSTARMHAYRPAELSGLAGLAEERDVAYCIGPPAFFPPSLVTAPPASEVTFIFPSWFTHRAVPLTEVGQRGEGCIRVSTREYPCGDAGQHAPQGPGTGALDDYLMPVPAWPEATGGIAAASDTVMARKVLLSGGWATWLDDTGERIRTLDPTQPSGSRVVSAPLGSVEPGTILILRRDAAERDLLLEQAMQSLGARRQDVEATQAAWKEALSARLHAMGFNAVCAELDRRGVKTSHRVQAWTDPALARPRGDQSYTALLDWLGIEAQPTITHAGMVRKARSRAAHAFTKKLEMAANQADVALLARQGNLEFSILGAGAALATQVLAISPNAVAIPRGETRCLLPDRSGRWLE